jgi:hypothetical protein
MLSESMLYLLTNCQPGMVGAEFFSVYSQNQGVKKEEEEIV